MWPFRPRIPGYDVKWKPQESPAHVLVKGLIRNGKGNSHVTEPIQGILDEIEKNLTEHEDAIKVISAFMEHHALGAASTDPTRLAAIRDKIQSHTVVLSQLLLKFPISG